MEDAYEFKMIINELFKAHIRDLFNFIFLFKIFFFSTIAEFIRSCVELSF